MFSIPGLERLVYRNPIAIKTKRTPSSMAANADSKLQAGTLKIEEQ
jgi:hypothetical protein